MKVKVIAAVVVAMGAGAGPALANGNVNNIVLESYTGDRPADATRLLQPVLTELSNRHYVSGDSVMHMIDGKLSLPIDSGKPVPPTFVADADRANDAFFAGQYTLALQLVNPLIDWAHTNPAAIAADPALRSATQKAVVTAALAYTRNGQKSEGDTQFAEFVRAFPDTPVQRGVYGEKASQAFNDVQDALKQAGTGTLTVKMADASADAFVDEAYIGHASPSIVGGEYRVFAKAGKSVSRLHLVKVPAKGTATVEIDVAFDAALHARATEWTGLEFADAADRKEHEGKYAQRVARAIDATSVVVFGIDTIDGQSVLVGKLVSLETGEAVRHAYIPLNPDPSTKARKDLAAYVAGDEPTKDVHVIPVDTKAPETQVGVHVASKGGGFGGWKYLTAIGATGGLVGGGILFAYDGSCAKPSPIQDHPCLDFRDTKGAAIAVGAAGVGLGILSVYLFVHSGHHTYVAPTADRGLSVGYFARF